jgi:hypothetical protein
MALASNSSRRKLYYLRVCGFALVISAFLIFAFLGRRLPLHLMSVGCLLAGISLVRRSRATDVILPIQGRDGVPPPTPLMWWVGVILAIMSGLSYYALRQDALHGYAQTWPVLAFSGSALVGGLWWAGLLARWRQ